ncbi:hypothetical protein DL95DRAFT_439524 [Leptodontidium sp. 2 PMI_412]|nr:hypothetical protein DL95DRAFT_439524 [Leptodontidium sp. 2 PMI_412]
MAEELVLNLGIASSLLQNLLLHLLCQSGNPFTEDLQHSWSDNGFPPFDVPFLRIWDNKSGSQPDNEGRMRSRAPRQRLDTCESRKNSLVIHINHGIWEPTPYISFTTSPAAIEEQAGWRASRQRGPQTLTVVDPNTRIADRLPILDVLAEMDHYGVKDPYGKSNQYYIHHYIIGHWEWNDLAPNENWYNDIILPAFRENATSRPLEEETSGLLAAMNQLSFHDYSDPSDPTHPFYGDSDSSSERITCYFDEELENDTDDEVEEANAADDMLKIIEGDW